MDESLLTLVLSSGVACERREASEWLDLKSRIEEERFRQLSADLERRRIRKYNLHLEEQKQVEQELNNLQRDRLRFEREKQLRRRNFFSLAREKKQFSKTLQATEKEKTKLPMNEKALGASASIAFDPKVEKYSRRRRAKTETFASCNSSKKAEKELANSDGQRNHFPNLSEEEVQRFHQTCKSAGKRAECRRWGAAWLRAKKEQDSAMEQNKRWITLLLNAEKENMRILSERWTALRDSRFPQVYRSATELDVVDSESCAIERNVVLKDDKSGEIVPIPKLTVSKVITEEKEHEDGESRSYCRPDSRGKEITH